jgi:hypothetical protein
MKDFHEIYETIKTFSSHVQYQNQGGSAATQHLASIFLVLGAG